MGDTVSIMPSAFASQIISWHTFEAGSTCGVQVKCLKVLVFLYVDQNFDGKLSVQTLVSFTFTESNMVEWYKLGVQMLLLHLPKITW